MDKIFRVILAICVAERFGIRLPAENRGKVAYRQRNRGKPRETVGKRSFDLTGTITG
ncbi:MAG: hypothetical protein LBE12_12390 [Planctomycetaceae bacterium]|jgi:hypothetical protein|nr:hypothetical protein [Planctomycetaceae bacterium]